MDLNDQYTVYADYLCPMNAPPARGGMLHIAGGKIVAVETGVGGEGATHRYPDCAITPGLVNAHAHLELSLHARPPKGISFVDWVIKLMSAPPTDPRAAVAEGVKQSLRAGVTCIGDISRQCAETRAALANGPLHVVSFGEITAMATRRALLEERLAHAATRMSPASRFVTVGISPHAPYSVEMTGYIRCVQTARERNLPITSHIAETPDEATFLAEHRGELCRIWEFLHAWDEGVEKFIGGSIVFAAATGLLDIPSVLAHVNFCNNRELEFLANGRASVCYCPRTHAYFGHPPHRWREMLAAGINVAIGADSVASSGDLNLLADLRLLRQIAPDTPALQLWQMATINGAKALGQASTRGTLEPGKAADFCVFPIHGDDPLKAILRSEAMPSHVYIGGQLNA